MAGQCYEALDQPQRACDAYLTALRCDPLGIAAAERLAEVAEGAGEPLLAAWSRRRLTELQSWETDAGPSAELAPYQRYAGQLGGGAPLAAAHAAS